MQDPNVIIKTLNRALCQYVALPKHSQKQELAFWNLEAALEDFIRFTQQQEITNDQHAE